MKPIDRRKFASARRAQSRLWKNHCSEVGRYVAPLSDRVAVRSLDAPDAASLV